MVHFYQLLVCDRRGSELGAGAGAANNFSCFATATFRILTPLLIPAMSSLYRDTSAYIPIHFLQYIRGLT